MSRHGQGWSRLDRAIEQVEYRQRFDLDDTERPLGLEPHGKDVPLEQRRARRHAEQAIDRTRDLAADRTERPDRAEATGHDRTNHGRPDHRDRDDERAM